MRRKRIRVGNDTSYQVKSLTPDPLSGGYMVNGKSEKPDTKFKVFIEPLSPRTVQKKYKKYLSKEDQIDLREYPAIYFVKKTHSLQFNFESSSNLFPFQRNGHIAYRYQQIEILGIGTFGIVINCYDHKTKKNYAVKLIKNNLKDMTQIKFEKEFLEILTSDLDNCKIHHVLPLQDYFTFRGYSCFVSELCPLNLYDYIYNQSRIALIPKQIRDYAKQIVTAIAFVHQQKIVHSDLKPTNILYKDDNLYLIDFGTSCYDGRPLYQTVQSLFYRAPEVVFGFRYGSAIDIWSLGCLLFELGAGAPLFPAANETALIQRQARLLGEPPAEMVRVCPLMQELFSGDTVDRDAANAQKLTALRAALDERLQGLADVVSVCLEWLPARRATAEDLLEMPFFSEEL